MVCSLRQARRSRSSGEPGIQAPATVAASTAAAPIKDASTTRPLRSRYMYQPTNKAIGIVHAIVNMPQELPGITNSLFSGKPPALLRWWRASFRAEP